MHSDDLTVIVGAGIAGLLCARTLTRAGHRVVVYERESEVGGRVRTTVQDGFRIDHGFQVMFSAYPVLTAALDLPALELREFRPAARIAMVGAPTDLIGDALADASLLWPSLRAASLSLLDKLRMLQLRYFATGLSFDECFAARFDRLSTREFLVARGFSAKAIDHFFAPFYGGILLDRTLESSASILLYTFKMLAQGRTTVPAAGMGAIPAQLAAGLPAGCIHTDTSVIRVTLGDNGRANGVVLADGQQISARRVVLACDPPAIAALALTAHVHVEVPAASLGCTTVYFRSSAPLLDGDALWLNSSPDATVSHAITITNVAPTYAPAGASLTAATVLGASAVLDETDLLPRVRKDLFAMGNQRSAESAELLAVWRVPYSQYAQSPGAVGRRVAAETAVSGLFLASELWHTSSLEGAARGGIAAAEAVIRSLVE